jgi:hypothetical protein
MGEGCVYCTGSFLWNRSMSALPLTCARLGQRAQYGIERRHQASIAEFRTDLLLVDDVLLPEGFKFSEKLPCDG